VPGSLFLLENGKIPASATAHSQVPGSCK